MDAQAFHCIVVLLVPKRLMSDKKYFTLGTKKYAHV